MIDLNRVENLVKSCSVQEMIAAMIWQRRFNEFDGKEVVEDLARYDDLWCSFFFSRPIYPEDKHSLSLNGLIETLLIMGNRRPDKETTFPQEFIYPGDTLFVLAPNQDTVVSRLLDLGEKWRTSETYIYDGEGKDFQPEVRLLFQIKLNHSLWGEPGEEWKDAVLVSFWWD